MKLTKEDIQKYGTEDEKEFLNLKEISFDSISTAGWDKDIVRVKVTFTGIEGIKEEEGTTTFHLGKFKLVAQEDPIAEHKTDIYAKLFDKNKKQIRTFNSLDIEGALNDAIDFILNL
jgi:hypothetical protein